jgi:predicted TIM-barrel fold metal-dependent hydrolase
MPLKLEYTEFDRSIWETELEGFVPGCVFDAHVHLWDDRYAGGNDNPSMVLRTDTDYQGLLDWSRRIFPSRRLGFLLLGTPVPGMDWRGYQDFMGRETARSPLKLGSTIVVPEMRAEELDALIRQHHFIGLKPYRFFAPDPAQCRIRDYLPEALLEVADAHGLAITLHLSRFNGIADAYNQQDLAELVRRYPKVRWILAHCARGFHPYTLEQSVFFLRTLPNLWYDLSAVCDDYSHYLLMKHEDPRRLMFGSDNVVAGSDHGNYITWGRGWKCFASGPLPHCESASTLVVYEQLRAMRHAADMAGLTASDLEAIFWRNAAALFGFSPEDMPR